jgi:hypothetical protein
MINQIESVTEYVKINGHKIQSLLDGLIGGSMLSNMSSGKSSKKLSIFPILQLPNGSKKGTIPNSDESKGPKTSNKFCSSTLGIGKVRSFWNSGI